MKSRQLLFSGVLLISALLTSCSFSPAVQKRFNLTLRVGGDYVDYDNEYISAECFKNSLTQDQFDELLSKGAKVISTDDFKSNVLYRDVDNDEYEGICLGTTYILEGPKLLLDKF